MPTSPNPSRNSTGKQDPNRRSKTRFEDLADLLPQIVFEIDEKLQFTFFNWNAIGITGYAFDEQAPDRRSFLSIIRPANHAAVTQFFDRLMTEVTSGHVECGLVAHNGIEIPAIIYASPIIGEREIAGIHGVIVDISEKIRLEQALALTNQKLNMMNSVTRHDVLNSVTGILGLCDMFAATDPDNPSRELVFEIRDLVVRIKEQILFTKDYQSVGVCSPQWQDLRQCVRNATPAAGRSGVQVHLPGAGGEIYADPLFGRVFSNLIDNSIRHGKTVRDIAVETETAPDGSLRIRYRDNGTGIPAGEKEKIFDQGYGKNTGFGLFFIREVLGITGLSIREIGTFGSGVVFEITVPPELWRAHGTG
jgi:PAS domain S-box-containing protein